MSSNNLLSQGVRALSRLESTVRRICLLRISSDLGNKQKGHTDNQFLIQQGIGAKTALNRRTLLNAC